MPGPFYFAYCGPGQPFDSSLLREDEKIVGIEITQTEGDFAQLRIGIRNPHIGLLAPGRQLWGFLSWDPGSGAIPLLYGRIIGVPEKLTDEIVTVVFMARPNDYIERKAALANQLRVLPWWDPVWLVDRVDDPDTVLETRSALWHVDRVTLGLSISDILVGEAGTVVIDESDHLYADLEVGYGEVPLRNVKVTGAVTWSQIGEGEIDITTQTVNAFRAAGSSGNYPLIGSMTGDGLFGSWPKPGTSIGGGWSIGPSSSIMQATVDLYNPTPNPLGLQVDPANLQLDLTFANLGLTVLRPYLLPGEYARSYGFSGLFLKSQGKDGADVFGEYWYQIKVPLHYYNIKLTLSYEAARPRAEQVFFNLSSDVQSVLTEADTAFTLNTIADLHAGSSLIDNVGTLEGVVPGLKYAISATGIPAGTSFVAEDQGQWSISGFVLSTTGNVYQFSTRVDHVGSTSGLVVGATYNIEGFGIADGTTFVAPRSGGILEISQQGTGNFEATELVITPIVAGLSITMSGPANVSASAVPVTITLAAANAAEEEVITLSSAQVDQLVDPGGDLPIGDQRRNSYFKTDRGAASFEFLVLLASAKLLARARTVKIKFRTRLETGIALTCRHSVQINDRRLPGGTATGKVIGYTFHVGTDGEFATIEIGCSVGRGNTLSVDYGTPTYVVEGYVEHGYQRYDSGEVEIIPGQVSYQSFDDFDVIDDDGIDLFNMTPANIFATGATDTTVTLTSTGTTILNGNSVDLEDTTGLIVGQEYTISGTNIPSGTYFRFQGAGNVAISQFATGSTSLGTFEISGPGEANITSGITVLNGPSKQVTAMDAAIQGAVPHQFDLYVSRTVADPAAALKAAPTRVILALQPVTGSSFNTVFDQAVSTLMVPQGIDLEAPSG